MAATETRPTKELVQELTRETSTLVRKELELAQIELKEKGRRAGIGGGMFGAAGVLALFGVGALVACAILALATAIAPWLAALVVAVVLLAVGGVVALAGRAQITRAVPPAPEQAIESVREDVRSVRSHAQHA